MRDDDELLDAAYHIDLKGRRKYESDGYNPWLHIGMALHAEGYSVEDWDEISRTIDPDHYVPGECEMKWETFSDDLGEDGISGKAIFAMAYEDGWEPERRTVKSRAFDWDDEVTIGGEVNHKAIEPPTDDLNLEPFDQITQQMAAMFEPDELVNITIRTWENDGDKAWDMGFFLHPGEVATAIKSVDIDPDCGACLCVNPTDGKRRKVEHLTALRLGLFESDEDDPETFRKVTRELDLPVVCEIWSGNRSVHTVVRLDAKDRREFKTRWRMVAEAYEAAGITMDKACSAPNKLVRLAGVQRGADTQRLLSGPFGPPTFEAWLRRHEKPLLPPFGNLDDIDQEIEDDPELVEGVLRYNEVALMTARAKRGKSWAMLDLAVAVATGGKWMGHQCTQGDVLYTDPELKPKSFKKRLKKICDARGVDYEEVKRHIVPWNLRGAFTTDGDAPDIVSIGHDIELSGRRFDLVILDSISAFLEPGQEENDNAYVRRFITGHVARIAKATGGAVVMIHHEGKGATGDRSAEDRARGAGAWVDCPDVVLQMSAIYPNNQETEDAMADLGVPYPAHTYGRRIKCVAIRDNAEFPDINLAFCPKTASFILDKAHKLDDWEVQTSAQIGGKKSGETRKAQAAKRAQEWTGRIISSLQCKDRDAVLTATECRKVVALGLGMAVEDVSLTTLKRYVDQCEWLEVDQTGPRRWGVKLVR